MTAVAIGSNIDAAPESAPESIETVHNITTLPEPTPVEESFQAFEADVLEGNFPTQPVEVSVPEAFKIPQSMDDINAVRALIQKDLDAAVADIERRLGQARAIEQAVMAGVPRQQIFTEDLNVGFAMVDGYTLTPNSPAGGSIAWASLHVVLLGVDYTITDGNTANKYVWFVKPGTYTPGTPMALMTSNTMPVLGANDALIFVNNAGTPVSVTESSIAYAVGDGVIGDAQISAAGISQAKITNLATALNSFTTDIARVEAKADGAITQHFGPAYPWANGSVQTTDKTGDVFTAQGAADQVALPDGRSWKWSGPSGAPANTWVLITDSDVTKALADSAAARNLALGKNTSYYRTVAQGAPPTPTDGFSTGDEWVQTDNGNYTQRWSGSAWVAVLFGDAAIATGISGAKIGSGINGSNVTTGTVNGALVGTGINGSNVTAGTVNGALVGTGVSGTNITTGTVPAARVGAGVAGAVLNSATGTISNSQLAANAVKPANINAAFHLLY